MLFKTEIPFDTMNTEEIFFRAIKENCIFQYDNCPEYKKILEGMNFLPDSIASYNDIEKIPFLPTLFFKNHRIFSVPSYKMAIKATSSGTKGKFSNVGFEVSGLLCGLKMVLKIGSWRKLFSYKPVNYVVFGYQPHRKNKTAVTKTAFGATLFAPAISRTYALKYIEDEYVPDFEGVINAIVKYSRSRFPLRFMGFPSYTYFVLKMMDERGLNVKLNKGSKILLGGGWKQFYTEQVEKTVLYDLAKKVLGIEETDIIEFFGAVEHPILYCDCENHHFHVPAYSRVIIRDVRTLKPVENGQIGLVNLITPMVKATPLLSVMTDDLGILHDGAECGCGISSPYLEIIGRVGLKDIKTCAAGAAEMITRVKI
jgi:phenylacetate-coenzyme A ligase PaaK-like adenylate-forming protein